MRQGIAVAFMSGALLVGSYAKGVVITTDNQVAPTNTAVFTPSYVPSTTDLIAGMVPSDSSGNFALETSGGLPVLTDGVYGPILSGGTGAHPSFATAGNGGGAGNFATYTLLPNATGYDLTSIVVFGGWNDAGRDQQAYNVLVSTIADPTTFIQIASVNFDPSNPNNTQSATRVTLTPDVGNNTLGTGIAAVKFDFSPSVENGYTGYAEINILGAASAPEPASLGLLSLGAVGLLARRRRAS